MRVVFEWKHKAHKVQQRKKKLYKRRGGRKQASKKKKTIYILNETTKNDHEFQGFNITQTL